MVERLGLLVAFIFVIPSIQAVDRRTRYGIPHSNAIDVDASATWKAAVHGWADFHKNLFSGTTLKVCAVGTPLYAMTRIVDDDTHELFYCAEHHKNRRQLPYWMYYAAEVGITTTITVCVALSVLSSDCDVKRTARLYALTLPTTYVIKKILKMCKWDAFARPKNEFFSCKKTYYGGCPSGHMMEMIYTAVLFGMECGPRFGVPLGIFTGALAVDFINHNRHFPSQIIAGAALGLVFAFAAHSALRCEKSQFSFDVSMHHDSFGILAEYRF